VSFPLILLGFPGLAWAGVEDVGIPWSLTVGDRLTDIVLAADESAVAALDSAAGTVVVLELATWTVTELSPCGGRATSLATTSGRDEIFVGCDDGSLTWLEVSSGAYVASGMSVDLFDQAIEGLAGSGDLIFGLVQDASSYQIQAKSYDPGAGTAGATPLVFTTTFSLQDVAGSSNAIVFSLEGNNVGGFNTTSGGTLAVTNRPAGTFTDVVSLGNAGFLIAAGAGGFARFQVGNNTVVAAGSEITDDVVAIGYLDDWAILADAGPDRFVFVNSDSQGVPGTSTISTLAWPGSESGLLVKEMVDIEGYSLAVTNKGTLWVLTERPWVEATSPVPDSGGTGTTSSFSFTSTRKGTWTLRTNGRSGNSGQILARGDVVADTATAVTFEIADPMIEGENVLRLVVEDEQGREGHDAVVVSKDDPPGKVRLSAEHVGEDHQEVRLVFPALSDADVRNYRVFVSEEPFTADDFASCDGIGTPTDPCGPQGSVRGGFSGPLSVQAEPGGRVRATIRPLTNYKTYYFAVRAYDASAQEGPMSSVVRGTPAPGLGPAELAGEKGGLCSTTGVWSGALGLLGGLAAAVARRRSAALLAVPLVGLFASVPDAHAQDALKARRQGNISVEMGLVQFDDPAITRVIGDTGNQLYTVQWGPHLIKQIELTGGVGYFKEDAKGVLEAGGRTDTSITIKGLPLTANLMVRLDFWDDQIIVPFAGVGGDVWFWKQEPYSGSGSLSGAKYGWHWEAGGQLLLDRVDPGAASKLQATTGIDNTWLVVDYHPQVVGKEEDGLYFTGQVFGFALKFDY
jgi:hypothetical protein